MKSILKSLLRHSQRRELARALEAAENKFVRFNLFDSESEKEELWDGRKARRVRKALGMTELEAAVVATKTAKAELRWRYKKNLSEHYVQTAEMGSQRSKAKTYLNAFRRYTCGPEMRELLAREFEKPLE